MRIIPGIIVLVCISVSSISQDYVDICDCSRGIRGVCREYLDSNWRHVNKENAVWYYYNYSFGRYRFFDWSWNNRFTRRHHLEHSGAGALLTGEPQPLNGNFIWKQKNSDRVLVEQSFEGGWPSGQTRAYTKNGNLRECLDFESPYNNGRFSMLSGLYRRGKLELQCVFAVNIDENRSFAVDVPSLVNEPPVTLGFIPKFQRSLVLDIHGLKNEYITPLLMPHLSRLVGESCYAPQAEPICYNSTKGGSVEKGDILSLLAESGGVDRSMICASAGMDSVLSSVNVSAQFRYEASEYQLMKTCRSELRQNHVRHMLVMMDTLEKTIELYGDSGERFKMTLMYVDRCIDEMMQYMRLNSRELDWNCVLVTSSTASENGVPWILWGEAVRSNYEINREVTQLEASSTFARFAHIRLPDALKPFVMKQCFYAEHKRMQ